MSSENTQQNRHDGGELRSAGYPLLALFFLVAACAILVALAAPSVTRLLNDEMSGFWFLGSSVVGMVFGVFVGLYHYRRARGVAWGLLSGMLIGALVGPLAVSPNYGQVMATCLGGSLLLVLLGACSRIIDRSA